ncbi:MAG TPA: hypothetical protein VIH59_21005 [Candidatus Tectomicrobia bacterium]
MSVLLAGIFLVTTGVPHFGTLWHTHEHGREEHTHASLFTTPEAHTHDHAVGPHTSHHKDEDTQAVSLSESEDADLHWHAFADSLPVGTVNPLQFFLVLYAVSPVVSRCISYRSRCLLCTSARAPPG